MASELSCSSSNLITIFGTSCIELRAAVYKVKFDTSFFQCNFPTPLKWTTLLKIVHFWHFFSKFPKVSYLQVFFKLHETNTYRLLRKNRKIKKNSALRNLVSFERL